MSDTPFQFDCGACGRHIVRFVAPPRGAADITLCAECTYMPGWFRDPELRRRFDPEFQEPPK